MSTTAKNRAITPKFPIGQIFTDPDRRKLKIHGHGKGGKYLLHYVIERSIPESALLSTAGIKLSDLKPGRIVLFPSGKNMMLIERQRSARKGSSEGFWFYRDPVDVVMTEQELDELVPPAGWFYQGPPKSALRRAR